MSVIETVRGLLRTSTSSPARGEADEGPTGAYWCDDCGERIPAAEVDGETPPACPGCGEAMRFERSMASTGCAC